MDNLFLITLFDKLPEQIRLKDKHKFATKDSVTVRCEDVRCQNFQISVRAGLKNEVEQFLKSQSPHILHSKFYIDMFLNVTTTREHRSGQQPIENAEDIETEESVMEEGIMSMKPLVQSNIKPTNYQGNDEKPNIHNTTMTLNALHLSILAKQSTIVELIMNHITAIQDEQIFSSTFDAVLGGKVVLDFGTLDPNLLKNWVRSLDGMNAFHLSCRYHPEAIEIMLNAMKKRQVAASKIMNLVQDNLNCMNYTPLHMAAESSLLSVTRYKLV